VTYRRILVPLKEDQIDDAVMEHAAYLAGLTGASVTLVHVVHSHSRDESAYREDQAREYLGVKARLLTGMGLEVALRVVPGQPGEAIARVAREDSMDLVVMATHGHGELHHLIVGSVTEDVLRRGDVPVLLISPTLDQSESKS
jgi:nucleotide-binding universal stress UspA family protein